MARIRIEFEVSEAEVQSAGHTLGSFADNAIIALRNFSDKIDPIIVEFYK